MRKHIYYLASLFFVLIGVFLILPYFWLSWMYAGSTWWRLGLPQLIAVVLGILPIYWASLALHVSANAVGALAARLRIVGASLGPLVIQRRAGRTSVSWARPFTPAGGSVAAISDDCRALWPRFAALFFPGPIANILVAAICFPLAASCNRSIGEKMMFEDGGPIARWLLHAVDTQSRTGAWLAAVALVNLFLGVVTFGSCLLELLFNWRRTKFRHLLGTLRAELWNGVRPCDWNPDLVDALLALRNGSRQDAWANLWGYFYELDVGQVARALHLLDSPRTPLARCPPEVLPSVLVEAAFVEGRFRRNPLARAWLDEVKEGQVEAHTRLRAEAAVLFAEGHQAEALAAAEAAIAAVIRSIDPGGAKAEAEWLHELLMEIKGMYSVRVKETNIVS